MAKRKPLYSDAQWNFGIFKRVYEAIEDIAIGELGLNIYPNQIEVITAEQMLDTYSSIGMPLMYNHWSFGKQFVRDSMHYQKGYTSLAYELVINSDPCISYVMEENSMTMQTLVIAHAAFGHNHFFKNNHLFQQWTDAETILDFLHYAKKFIADCEEKYGEREVEELLDSAHCVRSNAVDRYTRRTTMDDELRKARDQARREHERKHFNDLWRTLPMDFEEVKAEEEKRDRIAQKLGLPESNLLYFLERHSPKLEGWQREMLSIIRELAQYFYPQKQTKMMNEGCACYVHYKVMNRLYEKGLITEGAMLEFIDSHSKVVAQPEFNHPGYPGINPYALGFAMMMDIERICLDPTDEDKEWFPDFAGSGDPMTTLKYAWEHYRDESFILQYLSPRLIREFRFFSIMDDKGKPHIEINAIHNNRGYKEIRRALAASYSVANMDLDIQITDVDIEGDRTLTLTHHLNNGISLDAKEANLVLGHLEKLWGYKVIMNSVDDSHHDAK